MLRYDNILKFALVPSIVFLLLSVVSVALTTHYWILTDWVIPRGLKVVTSEFNDRLQQYVVDDTIVYFREAPTDATIVSGCLNLTAAVVALIAWSTLRKPDMDSQYNSVCKRSQPEELTLMSSRAHVASGCSVLLLPLLLVLPRLSQLSCFTTPSEATTSGAALPKGS